MEYTKESNDIYFLNDKNISQLSGEGDSNGINPIPSLKLFNDAVTALENTDIKLNNYAKSISNNVDEYKLSVKERLETERETSDNTYVHKSGDSIKTLTCNGQLLTKALLVDSGIVNGVKVYAGDTRINITNKDGLSGINVNGKSLATSLNECMPAISTDLSYFTDNTHKYALFTEVPTNVSQLQNDKEYLVKDDFKLERITTESEKLIVLTVNGKTFKIDTADFIRDGMIKNVVVVTNPGGQPEGKYLQITWNSDAGSQITYVDLKSLVDIYTSVSDGLIIDEYTLSIDYDTVAAMSAVTPIKEAVDTINDTTIPTIKNNVAKLTDHQAELETYATKLSGYDTDIGIIAEHKKAIDDNSTDIANLQIHQSEIETYVTTLSGNGPSVGKIKEIENKLDGLKSFDEEIDTTVSKINTYITELSGSSDGVDWHKGYISTLSDACVSVNTKVDTVTTLANALQMSAIENTGNISCISNDLISANAELNKLSKYTSHIAGHIRINSKASVSATLQNIFLTQNLAEDGKLRNGNVYEVIDESITADSTVFDKKASYITTLDGFRLAHRDIITIHSHNSQEYIPLNELTISDIIIMPAIRYYELYDLSTQISTEYAHTDAGHNNVFNNINTFGTKYSDDIILSVSGKTKMYKLSVNNISADYLSSYNLSSYGLTATTLSAINLSSDYLSANYLTAINLSSNHLSSNYLSATDLTANHLSASVLSSNDLSTINLTANNLTATTLSAINSSSDYLSANRLTANNLTATSLTTTNASITNANATNLSVGAKSIDVEWSLNDLSEKSTSVEQSLNSLSAKLKGVYNALSAINEATTDISDVVQVLKNIKSALSDFNDNAE